MQLLRDKEAAEMLGCGRSTFWRWVKDGVMPKPVKIAGNTRWKRDELERYITEHSGTMSQCRSKIG